MSVSDDAVQSKYRQNTADDVRRDLQAAFTVGHRVYDLIRLDIRCR